MTLPPVLFIGLEHFRCGLGHAYPGDPLTDIDSAADFMSESDNPAAVIVWRVQTDGARPVSVEDVTGACAAIVDARRKARSAA